MQSGQLRRRRVHHLAQRSGGTSPLAGARSSRRCQCFGFLGPTSLDVFDARCRVDSLRRPEGDRATPKARIRPSPNDGPRPSSRSASYAWPATRSSAGRCDRGGRLSPRVAQCRGRQLRPSAFRFIIHPGDPGGRTVLWRDLAVRADSMTRVEYRVVDGGGGKTAGTGLRQLVLSARRLAVLGSGPRPIEGFQVPCKTSQ